MKIKFILYLFGILIVLLIVYFAAFKDKNNNTLMTPQITKYTAPSSQPLPKLDLPEINKNTNLKEALDKLTPESYSDDFKSLNNL